MFVIFLFSESVGRKEKLCSSEKGRYEENPSEIHMSLLKKFEDSMYSNLSKRMQPQIECFLPTTFTLYVEKGFRWGNVFKVRLMKIPKALVLLPTQQFSLAKQMNYSFSTENFWLFCFSVCLGNFEK